MIFDCDGVLVDSDRISLRIQAEALAELGLPMTYEQRFEQFAGLGMPRTIEIVEERLGRSLPADWDAVLAARVHEAFERDLVPIPGVIEALDAIVVKTCVASSGTHDKMKLTLGLTDLYERFDGRIFSTTEVARGKPAPDLFLHAASQMAHEPARCCVVEDSKPGVEAARVAGMYAFGYAATTSPDLLDGTDTTVFDDMRLLPQLINGL
ncbi:MAG: HAD family hydrolase [Actinobacteria bacterium]|nr:HAD family hydrolase [Actinomycetota bacterium]